MNYKYSFIGAGKMASAIVKGLIAKGVSASEICCICGSDDTGKILSQATGIALLGESEFFANKFDVLALACKPQQLASISKLAETAAPEILVSILAGTCIEKLSAKFPKAGNIVRAMPNMAAQIGLGITCYASKNPLSDPQRQKVEGIFAAMGRYIPVEETQLDAVTALSGSGPGYIFEIADAMIQGGIKIGFSEKDAKELTYQTLIGSAALLQKSELSAAELRNAVSSPGGTTLAGLKVLSDYNIREAIEKCLVAAKDRSTELSKL